MYPRAWEQNKRQELEVEQSTSTLERSLHSDLAGRVHFQWKVNLKTTLDEPSTLLFAFHGVRPDARPTFVTAATKQARGANFAEASNRGHFYTWVDKVGSLYKETNWEPWTNYRVLGKWLDDLWTDGIHKCAGRVLDVTCQVSSELPPRSQVTASGLQGQSISVDTMGEHPHVSPVGQRWVTRVTGGRGDTFDRCCMRDQPSALSWQEGGPETKLMGHDQGLVGAGADAWEVACGSL